MSNEHEDQLTPAEREIEAALRALRPAAPGLDPVVVAFRAGAAQQRRQRHPSEWLWRAAAAGFAIAFGISLVVRPQDRPVALPVPIAVVERPTSPAPPAPHLAAMEPRETPSYRRLRQRVLDQGLDALAVPLETAAPQGQAVPRAGDTSWRSL